jgi:hypothetical protein
MSTPAHSLIEVDTDFSGLSRTLIQMEFLLHSAKPKNVLEYTNLPKLNFPCS